MAETALINTLECPSEFDVATSLRPGEPYFILAGRDRQAPGLVLQWAKANRLRALDEHDRELLTDAERDEELRKSTHAEQIAWGMQTYKAGHDRAKAPAVASEPYTGHVLPEETQRRDREQLLRVAAVTALHGAIAELEALRVFWAKHSCPVWARDCEARIAQLRDMTAETEPPRPVLG